MVAFGQASRDAGLDEVLLAVSRSEKCDEVRCCFGIGDCRKDAGGIGRFSADGVGQRSYEVCPQIIVQPDLGHMTEADSAEVALALPLDRAVRARWQHIDRSMRCCR